MLSIKALTAGSEGYYLHLAREDYYFNGGEPPGVWLGNGAAILGLTGEIEKTDLQALFAGFSPQDPAKPLVQNAGKRSRQPGWDLTFSAPKTVSVLWAAGERDVRQEIEAAHLEAVSETIAYLEGKLGHCRVGKGGDKRVSARLIVAAFGHSTSRALDPQLHHHCLVLNLGVGPDAKVRSIVSKRFYDHKMLLGALYRAELASQLRLRLRPLLRRKQDLFEVKGVDPALVQELSTRRREIEHELLRVGFDSAAAASVANLTTRSTKQVVPPRSELFQKWQAICQRYGLTPAAVKKLLNRRPQFSLRNIGHNSVAEAIEQLTAEQSHFSERELMRALAVANAPLGLGIADCQAQMAEAISSGRIIHIGDDDDEPRFTTREVLQLEEQLLTIVNKLSTAQFRGLSNATVTRVITKKRDFSELPPKPGQKPMPIVRGARAIKAALEKRKNPERYDTLSPEQANAVAHLTQGPGRIKVLTGLAGTTKTTTISAVREAFERQGYRVIGAALSGKAAEELSTRGGIEANTIRMRELQLYPTKRYRLRHVARQIYRAARYKTTSRLNRLRINRKTVLVVDEASMVGTKDMLMLARAVKRGGGILILVGDKDQLASIEAGGPLGSIANRIGGVHLVDILRQSYPKDRQAVAWMPAGKAEHALAHYADCGQLHVTKSDELLDKIIHDWTAAGGPDTPHEHIMCTALNREVDTLNDSAQAARMQRGLLNPKQRLRVVHKCKSAASTKETFYTGDRLVFTARSQKYKIENGTTATLVAVSKSPVGPSKISVLVDGEKKPRVLPVKGFFAKKGVQFRRGYAFTTHKLQGATARNVYVALSGSMLSREMAYVEFSRHKEKLSLYTTDKLVGKRPAKQLRSIRAGKAVPARIEPKDVTSPLTKLFAHSRAKNMARDVLEEERRGPTVRYLTREQACEQLRYFSENGNLLVSPTDHQLKQTLLDDWQRLGGIERPQQQRIYALLNEDRDVLNRSAQKLRLNQGHLDPAQRTEINGVTLYAGDQVCLTGDARAHGLVEGQSATVTAITRRRITLKVNDKDQVTSVPVKNVPLALAYALPTQQLTKTAPEDALVMLTDVCSDQQLSYVNQSVHKRSCRLYTSSEIAGPVVAANAKSRIESPALRQSPAIRRIPTPTPARLRSSLS